MDTVDAILEELGLLPAARTIYMSLLRDGEAIARVLSERTGITRPSVYDQVRDLRNRGLVVERDIDGKTYFGATDVRHLTRLLEDHIERLEIGRGLLEKNMQTLLTESRTVQPKIRFFEGADGVREMLKDMLWHDHIEVSMCWPYTHMVNVLGTEYLAHFNARRIKNHIRIRTVWQAKEKKLKTHTFVGADQFVERRYARAGQVFTMSYAIYDDTVAFISSSKEAYGFIVQSREFADLMQMQFEAVWAGK